MPKSLGLSHDRRRYVDRIRPFCLEMAIVTAGLDALAMVASDSVPLAGGIESVGSAPSIQPGCVVMLLKFAGGSPTVPNVVGHFHGTIGHLCHIFEEDGMLVVDPDDEFGNLLRRSKMWLDRSWNWRSSLENWLAGLAMLAMAIASRTSPIPIP